MQVSLVIQSILYGIDTGLHSQPENMLIHGGKKRHQLISATKTIIEFEMKHSLFTLSSFRAAAQCEHHCPLPHLPAAGVEPTCTGAQEWPHHWLQCGPTVGGGTGAQSQHLTHPAHLHGAPPGHLVPLLHSCTHQCGDRPLVQHHHQDTYNSYNNSCTIHQQRCYH